MPLMVPEKEAEGRGAGAPSTGGWTWSEGMSWSGSPSKTRSPAAAAGTMPRTHAMTLARTLLRADSLMGLFPSSPLQCTGDLATIVPRFGRRGGCAVCSTAARASLLQRPDGLAAEHENVTAMKFR